MNQWWILLIISGVVLFLALYYYNSLVSKKNLIEQAFSTIDVMLMKRCDLVPNLVAVAKEYMRHEAETLEKITALRARAVDSGEGRDARLEANNDLGRTLGNLMVQLEGYPQLKANENFLHLQRSLNEIEEQLAASRRAYNAAANEYNTSIEMIPGNILAVVFRFRRAALLDASERERQVPDAARLFKS